MATTGTLTVRDIVEAALLDIEVGTLGQAASADRADHARKALNRLMKSWQLMEGTPAFLKASQTVTATTSATQTLDPIRPLRIVSARVQQGGTETRMIPLTRDEYDELPNKSATGLPTQYYYDRQKEAALFYVWPLFASVTTETFIITYEREFEDIASLNDTIDLPSEWYDVAVKQLAARLVSPYGSEAAKQRVPVEADTALRMALGHSAAGESVYWRGF